MHRLFLLACLAAPAPAQDPYTAAPEHYHLAFENSWVRATRVTYEAHSKAPVHEHPPTPTTLYVYVTDGGPMQFHHVTGDNVAGLTITRKAVAAGAMRFAHGAPETHTVEYLGEAPMEYARIELRTEPLDRPARDVRLPTTVLDPARSAVETRFENRQVRILHVMCAPAEPCPASAHPDERAVVVILKGPRRGEIEWSPENERGPLEEIRLELKTK